jgi:hypothetical protein
VLHSRGTGNPKARAMSLSTHFPGPCPGNPTFHLTPMSIPGLCRAPRNCPAGGKARENTFVRLLLFSLATGRHRLLAICTSSYTCCRLSALSMTFQNIGIRERTVRHDRCLEDRRRLRPSLPLHRPRKSVCHVQKPFPRQNHPQRVSMNARSSTGSQAELAPAGWPRHRAGPGSDRPARSAARTSTMP